MGKYSQLPWGFPWHHVCPLILWLKKKKKEPRCISRRGKLKTKQKTSLGKGVCIKLSSTVYITNSTAWCNFIVFFFVFLSNQQTWRITYRSHCPVLTFLSLCITYLCVALSPRGSDTHCCSLCISLNLTLSCLNILTHFISFSSAIPHFVYQLYCTLSPLFLTPTLCQLISLLVSFIVCIFSNWVPWFSLLAVMLYGLCKRHFNERSIFYVCVRENLERDTGRAFIHSLELGSWKM